MCKHLVWSEQSVDEAARAQLFEQKPCCIWLTGLSGAGKSTLAHALDLALHQQGYHSYVLDGDNVRHGLCNNLGFSALDRAENIRRVAEAARLMVDAGLIVIVSLISPFRADRDLAKKRFPDGGFIEVHVDAELALCETRDPKGLYAKARQGLIQGFTGICSDSPYEKPLQPDLRFDTSCDDVNFCIEVMMRYLKDRINVINAL